MKRVIPSTSYRDGALGSSGNAEYMLLKQYQFPNQYDEKDVLCCADHDRCLMWDRDHAERCFQKHIGTGELAFGDWVRRATNDQVMAFLKDILKAKRFVKWTGFRVMGTVNRTNGYPVWTLELFAKHPATSTKVYGG